VLRYSNLTDIKMATVFHHLRFLEIQILMQIRFRGPICVSVPSFMTISLTVGEI